MGNEEQLRRRAVWASAGALGLGAATVATGVAGSERIRDGALAPMAEGPAPGPDVRVVDVVGDGLVLEDLTGSPRDLNSPLVLGLQSPSGYGQLVGDPQRMESGIWRNYLHLQGTPPRRGGVLKIDLSAFADAEHAVGVQAEPIDVESDLGRISALHVPGARGEWVVLVHGRISAPYREPLRMLRPFVRRGHPALIVSYRNAAGAPRAPDGISRFGLDEWADIAAGVAVARSRGADSVILGGLSMGAAIAMAAAERIAPREAIRGLVLDSPVLDLWATIGAGAARRLRAGVVARRLLLACTKPVTRVRFGLDWRALDHTRRADSLSLPTLLFHGSADRVAPVDRSDALAAERPDLVVYRRTPGVGHVRSWNASPDAYEDSVAEFLERVAPGTG